MKFKVKGLVFVGFAAAILSANAALADPDNTVTSKSYVDTHFQEKVGGGTNANKLVQATDTAGVVEYVEIGNAQGDVVAGGEKVVTGNAVAAALAQNGGTVESGTLTVKQNGDTKGTFSANETTGTNVEIALTDTTYSADGTTITLDTTTNTFSATAGSIAPDNTGLVNGGQVYTGLAAKEDVSNKTDTVAAAGSTDNDKYPSETAVRTAIDAVSNAAANTYQAKSTADLQIGTAGGVFRDMTTTEKAALASGITSTKVGDYDNHIADTSIHVTPADKTNWNAKVDTALGAQAANKTLITDANGNVTVSTIETAVIPAIDPAVCNATTPCALVTNETTGAAEWQPIAQATANVGE